MTETSEEKTKREYIRMLASYEWSHQHSVFYQDEEESINLLDDMVAFKKLLRRRHPDQPFLIRIQMLNKKLNKADGAEKKLQAYLVIITTKRIKDIKSIAESTFCAPVNILGRPYRKDRIERNTETIKKESSHNLKNFFGDKRIKRWTLINRHLLQPISEAEHLEHTSGDTP